LIEHLVFTALEERYKKSQVEAMDAYRERQKRLQQLNQLFDQLREIWKPRLEMLIAKFGDRVKATPRLVPSTREATLEFQSKLAKVRLRFSATTDRDITRVILSDDLEIIPILVRYDAHSELEFPLDAVDTEAVAPEGAIAGVTAGVALGGLLGAALATVVIPGVGPVIAGGLLAAVLTGAAAGAAGGASWAP
jgi:hypothetical protein